MPQEPRPKNQHIRPDNPVRGDTIDTPDTQSVCSMTGNNANKTFFKQPGARLVSQPEQNMHRGSVVWTSWLKNAEQDFKRIRKLLRHVAPEQFRKRARPSGEPCDIVPTTETGYVDHVVAMARDEIPIVAKNKAAEREAIRLKNITEPGEVQPEIKPIFGHDAKIYQDGFSPVLCRATMWSAEYNNLQSEKPKWPNQIELQECGDRRENDTIATRCGRYLPLPKIKLLPRKDASSIDMGTHEPDFRVKRFLPMDEPGPIFHNGPSPVEIADGNMSLDNDPSFEERGKALLGSSLMKEVGQWKAPYTPEWLVKRRQREALEEAMRMSHEQALWIATYGPY